MKKFNELTLQDDFMFGIVMRRPNLCKMCLERILNKTITQIDFPESQKNIDMSVASKSIRLDIYCEGEEAVYNIEMQRSDFPPQRGRYYQGMMDIDNIGKGQYYSELKNNIVIFICTFDKYGKERHLYTFENRCIQDLDVKYGDGTQKIVLNTKGILNDIPEPLKNFLDYIDHGAVTDEFTSLLDKEVISTRNNEKWRMDYMTYSLKIDDERYNARKEGLAEGRAEGRAEGLEEGRAEGLTEGDFGRAKSVIYNMIEKKLTFAEIVSFTGIDETICKKVFNMYDIDHNNYFRFEEVDMEEYIKTREDGYKPVNASIFDDNITPSGRGNR